MVSKKPERRSSKLQVLLEEVAKLYTTITPQDVLAAAPEELIFLAMSTLVQAGDTVITTYPGPPHPSARTAKHRIGQPSNPAKAAPSAAELALPTQQSCGDTEWCHYVIHVAT